MSDFGQYRDDDPADAAASSDSPKPHGGKLASARRTKTASERPEGEGRGPSGAIRSGDSPKPHGDKLANAVPGAPKGGQPDR